MEERVNTSDPKAYNTKRRSYELPTVWDLCCRRWPLRPRWRTPVILHVPRNKKPDRPKTPARFFDSVALVVGQRFRRKPRAIPSAPRAAPSNITVAPLSGTATPVGGRGCRSALTWLTDASITAQIVARSKATFRTETGFIFISNDKAMIMPRPAFASDNILRCSQSGL